MRHCWPLYEDPITVTSSRAVPSPAGVTDIAWLAQTCIRGQRNRFSLSAQHRLPDQRDLGRVSDEQRDSERYAEIVVNKAEVQVWVKWL